MFKADHLVSVIIPCFNAEKFLKECVESAQEQTYQEIEIIVIDDGSTDQSLTIAEHLALKDKRITSEVCIHHLWFSDEDYKVKGNLIKWNPAVKSSDDRLALREALKNDILDVIATDHAPHTLEEKKQVYTKAPSGGPLVQHGILAMMEAVRQEKISIEKVVEKMCHNPARLFKVEKRGFVKKGYVADLVLIDTRKTQTVSKENILYKCGWSPFEGTTFHSEVTHTFVNGHLIYNNGVFNDHKKGKRLLFER